MRGAGGRGPTRRPRPAGRLKMKDLERATGVGRETIRFYIREGLLPEPERPGRNVAWYDASFVERIRLIKDLQGRRFLPLHVIKAILDGDAVPPAAEVQALLDLEAPLLDREGSGSERRDEKLASVARRTGLAAAEIRRLADAEAIAIELRRGVPWLAGRDVELVGLWARLRDAGYGAELGFKPENLRVYVDTLRWLAREELRMFARGVAGKVDAEKAASMAEAGIDLVNQMIALLRRGILLRYIAEGNVPAAEGAPPEAAPG
jgi:DNA-binding transcriptional MerR regulator